VAAVGPVIAAGFVLSIIEDNGALPRRGRKRTGGLYLLLTAKDAEDPKDEGPSVWASFV